MPWESTRHSHPGFPTVTLTRGFQQKPTHWSSTNHPHSRLPPDTHTLCLHHTAPEWSSTIQPHVRLLTATLGFPTDTLSQGFHQTLSSRIVTGHSHSSLLLDSLTLGWNRLMNHLGHDTLSMGSHPLKGSTRHMCIVLSQDTLTLMFHQKPSPQVPRHPHPGLPPDTLTQTRWMGGLQQTTLPCAPTRH